MNRSSIRTGYYTLPPPGSARPISTEDTWRQEFLSNPTLWREFGGHDRVEDYLSFRRAVSRGLVKLYSGRPHP